MICLLQMPFCSVTQPSLALSLFKTELAKRGIPAFVEYASLRYFKILGAVNYTLAGERWNCFAPMAGEFVFLQATGLRAKKTDQDYFTHIQKNFAGNLPPELANRFIGELPELAQQAQAFVRTTAERILVRKPKVIACAASFLQINSTIAVLKCLKEMEPGLVTIVGGANCSGPAGISLVNDISWIDYVFSGEADECIAEFCELALEHGNRIPVEHLPFGVLAKGELLEYTEHHPCRVTQNLNGMAIPDFEDYFETLETLQLHQAIEAGLNVEFSRGCWWGEKHPCTFCGLNGQINKYRAKSPDRILKEIEILADRYQMKRIGLADNILSMDHLRELIPRLIQRNDGYTFFSEIKTNISRSEMQQLHNAGFLFLQPGIESLQDSVLQTMNKGNKAIRHIEFLKNAQEIGIRLFWNLLGGFPQEEEAWFAELADTLSLITHLQPPQGFKHIVFQRYSVYLKNSAKYGLVLKPAEIYDYVLPDLQGFVENVAYQYEPVEKEISYWDIGKKEKAYADVETILGKWTACYRKNPDRLDYSEKDGATEIMDLRACAIRSMYLLEGLQHLVYQACKQVVSLSVLQEKLAECYTAKEVMDVVDELEGNKLLVRMNQEVLALAVKREHADFADERDCPTGRIKSAKAEAGEG